MPDQTVTAKFVADISNFQSNLRALQASARELKASAADMSTSLSQSGAGMQSLSQAATASVASQRSAANSARESRQSFISLAGSAAEVAEELGEVVGAVVSVVSALGKQRDAVVASERAFNSFTLNVAETKKQLEAISKLDSSKAFGTQTIAGASAAMQRLGMEADKATKLVDRIANSLAAAGQGADNIMPIALKMKEISEQATVTAKDIDELALLGMNSWKNLEFQTGKTQEQLKRDMESGAISGKKAYELLFNGMQRDMGAAGQASKDFGSSWNRLATEFSNSFGPMIDKIAEFIGALADLEKQAHLVSGALKFIFAPGLLVTDLMGAMGLPGHASGVKDNPVGHVGWVGEDGPELMFVPERATIFPTGMNPFESNSPSSSPSPMGGASRGMQLPMTPGETLGPIILQVKLDSKVVAQQTFPHLSAMIREFKGVRK